MDISDGSARISPSTSHRALYVRRSASRLFPHDRMRSGSFKLGIGRYVYLLNKEASVLIKIGLLNMFNRLLEEMIESLIDYQLAIIFSCLRVLRSAILSGTESFGKGTNALLYVGWSK